MTNLPNTGQLTPASHGLRPHRSGTVLTLGILSLVFGTACGAGLILGGIGWSMANNDLREMDGGTMDPSGRSNTQAGKVCAIIGTILGGIGAMFALFYLFVVVLAIGGAAMSSR